MPENTNAQIPATENQIELTRPKVGRSFNLLTGHIEGSMNAGHKRIIAYQEVMAGSKIAVSGGNLLIQMLTPKTPAFQKLKAVVEVVKVPFKRVWDNYEEFAAQKGGASEEKPQVMPNFAGKEFPIMTVQDNNDEQPRYVSLQETTDWRDNIFSCLIPRVGAGEIIQNDTNENIPYNKVPAMTALYCRAHVAAYNDIFRNKEYSTEKEEYKSQDVVTMEEWSSYLGDIGLDFDYFSLRTKKDNSYYSNYRAELAGFETDIPGVDNELPDNEKLINFSEWLHESAEAMAQASNAQKNAWDVYTSLRGAKKLTEGRVQLLSRKTFPISYSTVTQNAYNNNPEIEERFRVLGKQGAFSFTNIDLAWLNGIEIKEDGVLLVYMTITADTIYESAVDRTLLNINWKDRYRPDLAKEKNDILMKIETGTPYALNTNAGNEYEPLGFKRRYSEMFKLPCCINGEMMNRGYLQTKVNEDGYAYSTRIESNDTFQFNEFSAEKAQQGVTKNKFSFYITPKKHWLDYSDLMVNKNLAIPQETDINANDEIILKGPHQIFYAGETYCIVDMPIEEDSKTNFVKWSDY